MVFRTIGCLWLASFGITSTLLAQTGGAWNKAFSAAAAQGFADAHGYAGVGFAPALISIAGKPFTATRTYTDKRKDADGVHEFPPLSADFTIARDDKGRIHYEMAFEQVRNGKLVIGGFDVQIYDPVAHTWVRYFLDGNHEPLPRPVAELHKLKLMSELVHPLPSGKTGEGSSDPGSSVTPEPLDSVPDPPSSAEAVAALPKEQEFPKRSIDGVIVVGHRIMVRYGKKYEYFQIQDNWFSPEYALDIRQIVLRETIGKETVETSGIVPGEPDPALFEIPLGYVTHIVR